MSHELPLHLTFTGRPLLLYPAIVPELHARLQSAYAPRASRLFNRAKRIKAKKPKALNPQDHAQTAAASMRHALSSAPAAAIHEPYIEQISISGPLLNKAESFDGMLCVDGYDRIEAALSRAVADTDCAAILMDIDSPGGMVTCCFELAEKIRDWAKVKPIIVHCSGLLCSAAYALASGATEIIAQKTALIGSIGVVFGRLDVTGHNEKNGFKIDFIQSGEQKSWGNPETSMEDAELAAHQTQVLELADMFFAEVSQGRGLDIETLKSFQAGTFLGTKAVDNGLLDGIGDMAFAMSRAADLAANPMPAPKPGLEPAPEPKDTPTPDSTPAALNPPAKLPSTKKETPMSKFTRGGLAAKLALTASAMAMNAMDDEMDDDAKKSIDEEALETDVKDTAQEEANDEVEAMDDDEVEAMDEEIDAMDDDVKKSMEDDDIEAMDEDADDMTDEAGKKAMTFAASASRIAHRTASAVARKHKLKAAKSSAKSNHKTVADAVSAERNRVSAIQSLPQADANPGLVKELIAKGTSAEDAKAFLKASGSRQAGSRMGSVQSPNIGTGTGAGASKASGSALDQVLRKHQAKKSGRKVS